MEQQLKGGQLNKRRGRRANLALDVCWEGRGKSGESGELGQGTPAPLIEEKKQLARREKGKDALRPWHAISRVKKRRGGTRGVGGTLRKNRGSKYSPFLHLREEGSDRSSLGQEEDHEVKETRLKNSLREQKAK